MSKTASLAELKGLGPKSASMLKDIGIQTVDDLINGDPFAIYQQLHQTFGNVSLNFLYALFGAQENCHWQHIARTRREEILMTLDDMGLAPK